jgi:hypothetical protein
MAFMTVKAKKSFTENDNARLAEHYIKSVWNHNTFGCSAEDDLYKSTTPMFQTNQQENAPPEM